MQRMHTYLIQLDDNVDASEINAASPLQVTAEQLNSGATRLTVCTDQSGLVGLLRYLHGLGFVLLALTRTGAPDYPPLAAKEVSSTE